VDSENGRVQTAYAKHANRLNFIYCDGHAAPRESQRHALGTILWGIHPQSHDPDFRLFGNIICRHQLAGL
jgi:prepilin-type processing-associated H-X9-DG protein